MRKILITSLLAISTILVCAQGTEEAVAMTTEESAVEMIAEPTCFQKWDNMFSTRGANKVEDGTNQNIIITIRTEEDSDCYIGKATVEAGKVKHVYAMVEGGGYELFIRKYQHETPQTISNGVSKTRITANDELVNILFTENIKAKKRDLVRAPEPHFE